MVIKTKNLARNLIYIHLILDMYVRTLSKVIVRMTFLEYFPDLINAALLILCLIYLKFEKNKINIIICISVSVLFFFDIMRYETSGENFILFVWEMRNDYRFIIFFVACVVFFSDKDVKRILQMFTYLLPVNFFMVVIEYAFGLRRDHLGGPFGFDNNTSSIINIYLCIVFTNAIISYIYKKISLYKMIGCVCICSAWAALSEIKIFYIEMVMIFLLSALDVGKKVNRTLKAGLFLAIPLVLGCALLFFIFPDQLDVMNKKNLALYIGHRYGGWTASICRIIKIIFKRNLWEILFGVGLGNSGFLDIQGSVIKSKVYDLYGFGHSYLSFYYTNLFVKRGIIGVFLFFIFTLFSSIKLMLQNRFDWSLSVSKIVSIVTLIITLLTFYNTGIHVSTAGYFSYFVIASSYILLVNTKNRRKRRINYDSAYNTLLLAE